jgi:hypothetical protein
MNWWMSGQRFLRKVNKMPDDRIALLDEIGFVWSTKEKAIKPEKKRKKQTEEVPAPLPSEPKPFESDHRVTRRRDKTVFSDYVDSSLIYPEPRKRSKVSPPATRSSSPLTIKEEIPVEESEEVSVTKEDKVAKDDMPTWMQNYTQYVLIGVEICIGDQGRFHNISTVISCSNTFIDMFNFGKKTYSILPQILL